MKMRDDLDPNGWIVAKPPVPKKARRARLDFLRQSIADLPDPRAVAFYLEAHLAFALLKAWQSQDPANAGQWRVADEYTRELQALGLVACGGPYLNNFGKDVRRALREMEQ